MSRNLDKNALIRKTLQIRVGDEATNRKIAEFTLLLLLSAMLPLNLFTYFASANFSYHMATVTVISPVTDKVYAYGTNIPLSVKVEMYPHSIINLGAEELAEVRYSLDGQPEKSAAINNEVPQSRYCTGYANATISGLSKGIHKLFIRGHTNFGDFSSPSVGFNRTVYFIVDSVSATINVISPQQITYYANTVSLNFSSFKPLTWA